MNILAINGSPRKTGNTATLLQQTLAGAASQGATTELIHLYDLNYKGCVSCFACKRKNGPSYGVCAYQDDLTPIFAKLEHVDAIILGSPIYLGNSTGEMRSFLERLVFQYLVYDATYSSLFTKKIPVGFIYTMNITENQVKEFNYEQALGRTEMILGRIFGSCESLYVCDTYQFSDYSQYVASAFNEEHKAQRRNEVFPRDCQKAFALGARFAAK